MVNSLFCVCIRDHFLSEAGQANNCVVCHLLILSVSKTVRCFLDAAGINTNTLTSNAKLCWDSGKFSRFSFNSLQSSQQVRGLYMNMNNWEKGVALAMPLHIYLFIFFVLISAISCVSSRHSQKCVPILKLRTELKTISFELFF